MIKRITRRRSAALAAGLISLGIFVSGPADAAPGGPGDISSTPTTQPCNKPNANCDKAPRPKPGDECDPKLASCDIANGGGGGGNRPGGGDGTKVGGGDIVRGNPTFTG